MKFYEEIKEELVNNEINRRVKKYSVNKSDLNTYYNVSKMLFEAGKHYGEGIIKKYLERLTAELGKGYSTRTLKYMRKFYDFQKGQPMVAELSWSHYTILLSLEDYNMINYYISVCLSQNLSKRELTDRIKLREYERLPETSKNKIICKRKTEIKDLMPNPIIIKNSNNIEVITEKVLKKMILENIESFMKELGNSFSFIGSEYKIKIGNTYNYIDLLLYNYEYNSFVVIELKVTELKKEHVGQIQIYMNYIDCNLRKSNQNKTIGIIICKKDNKYIVEYCSDNRIIAREYKILYN